MSKPWATGTALKTRRAFLLEVGGIVAVSAIPVSAVLVTAQPIANSPFTFPTTSIGEPNALTSARKQINELRRTKKRQETLELMKNNRWHRARENRKRARAERQKAKS